MNEDMTEVFYTFTWAGRAERKGRPGGKPQGKGGAKGRGKPKGKRPPQDGGGKPQNYSARPPREKKIDPDNPFAAALQGFKGKS